MVSERYSWCELFVDATDEGQVLDEARRFFRVADRDGTFDLPAAEVEIRHAQEWPSHPDHFEGWRALVEIDARADATDEEILHFVTELMQMLRSHGHRVVSDCDFPGLPQEDFEDIRRRGWPLPIDEIVLKRDPRQRP
jgi:hypothetical protein